MEPKAHRRVAAALGVVVVVACAGIAATPHVGVAQATAAASPAVGSMLRLPAAPVVGEQVELSARLTHADAAGTFEIVLTTSTAIFAVNADGSYVTRSTIGSIDVIGDAGLAGVGVDGLPSQSFEQTFTGAGAARPELSNLIGVTALTPEQHGSGRAVADALSMVAVGFPDEPVAVGSSWTSSGAVSHHGILVPVSYQCHLTSIAGGAYTMDVSYSQLFSQASDEGMIEATVAGTGTVVGSLSNPLVVDAVIYQSIDGVQGAEPLHVDTAVTVTSNGA